jgi:murein DD-endopeptidase MepM/ murein hydrolase activator NlpD
VFGSIPTGLTRAPTSGVGALASSRSDAGLLSRSSTDSAGAVPRPGTGAHRHAAARPVSSLRGFPPVRPDGLPVPRAAADDLVSPVTTVLPDVASVDLASVDLASVDLASVDLASVDLASVDLASVDLAPAVAVPGRPAAAAVPDRAAAVPAGPVVPRARRRSLRDRRPYLLLVALVAGAVGAGVVGLPGAPQDAGPATVLSAQMELFTGDEAEEVMPMASITEAEALARLQEVAASRTARAAAQAAAAEAAEVAAAAAAEAARPKTVLPVDGARFTSGFGSRWGTFHYGIDLAAPIGTPEYAAADGVVVRAGAASGFGLAVYVLHENGDVTVYGHMEKILVRAGQYVEAGETIALLGNRGQSTGPHLHFEVHQGGIDGRRIDPVDWLADRGVEV